MRQNREMPKHWSAAAVGGGDDDDDDTCRNEFMNAHCNKNTVFWNIIY
jgi:hypothetical protein